MLLQPQRCRFCPGFGDLLLGLDPGAIEIPSGFEGGLLGRRQSCAVARLPRAGTGSLLLQCQHGEHQLLHAEDHRTFIDPLLQPMRTLPRVGADHGRWYPLTQRHIGIQTQVNAASTNANVPLSQGIPAAVIGTYTGKGTHRLEEWIDERSVILGMKQLV
ncbi:MAG TPA: hypothetical protein VHN13_22255, partial [Candidatus Tectomicrobia bacterium]|nr:hypothetical protein [Candidatus Tectomicrobia bacterium]